MSRIDNETRNFLINKLVSEMKKDGVPNDIIELLVNPFLLANPSKELNQELFKVINIMEKESERGLNLEEFFNLLKNSKIMEERAKENTLREEKVQPKKDLALDKKLELIEERNLEKNITDKLSLISEQYNANILDWNNTSKPKYYINIDYKERVMKVNSTFNNRQIGVVYFNSKEIAYMALDILKEELIALI